MRRFSTHKPWTYGICESKRNGYIWIQKRCWMTWHWHCAWVQRPMMFTGKLQLRRCVQAKMCCAKTCYHWAGNWEEIMKVAAETGKVFTVESRTGVWTKDFVAMRRAVEQRPFGRRLCNWVESGGFPRRALPAGGVTKKQGGGMDAGLGRSFNCYDAYDAVTNVFCKMYSINYDVDDNFRLTMTLDNGA